MFRIIIGLFALVLFVILALFASPIRKNNIILSKLVSSYEKQTEGVTDKRISTVATEIGNLAQGGNEDYCGFFVGSIYKLSDKDSNSLKTNNLKVYELKQEDVNKDYLQLPEFTLTFNRKFGNIKDLNDAYLVYIYQYNGLVNLSDPRCFI